MAEINKRIFLNVLSFSQKFLKNFPALVTVTRLDFRLRGGEGGGDLSYNKRNWSRWSIVVSLHT